ncbi:hypothetical protein JCM10207_001453 [Rhodosporidiobolus poonsookiae]
MRAIQPEPSRDAAPFSPPLASFVVTKKNDDELLQNFFYHTRQTNTPSLQSVKDVSTGTDKGQMKDDANQAVEHLRTLGKLIFTNSEARKLLMDTGFLGRDVAADAAVKAADVARPNEEQLRQVDEPAPSNQWVGPNGEVWDHRSPAPDTGLHQRKELLESRSPLSAADGQFSLTFDPKDKLVDWEAKDSMVEKIAVKQQQAGKSEGWKSPAFTIVGAGASNSGEGHSSGSAAKPAHQL